MPLSAGARLGAYEILSFLGAGGMGEVYRARDTRLSRDAALKILPAEFAADGERLARFKREAHMLASLNHPNIAAIYGIETSDGVEALVLELVEGPTLADRIAKGPVPVEDALPIAKQIADALEAAHDQGIIHRDLKPANIKIRDDGAVKVLDFGLAKLTDPRAAADAGRTSASEGFAVTQSPTITTPAPFDLRSGRPERSRGAMVTGIGVILGTAPYMSPEQAKGRAADKRSDIWAFGCVLYEMLTGKRAFDAEDVAETLALVMTRSPDWEALPPTVPTSVRRLLQRCLERDRRRRLADIADARLEIDEAALSTPVTASSSASPRSNLRQWLGVVAGLLVVGIVALAAWTMGRRTATTDDSVPVFRAEIPLPAALSGDPGSRFAISPDGRRLAFVAPAQGGRTMLWVRSLDASTAQPLAGTEGAAAPFWSPDSRFIAFTAAGKLKRIAESGGPIVSICDVEAAFPGAWNHDGVILFTPRDLSGLFRVPARGGSPTRATTPDQPNVRHAFPTFLPDGRHFVYYSSTPNGSARQVRIAALDGQESTIIPVPAGANSPSFANGRLLYVSASTLFAQPIETVRFEMAHDAAPLTEDVDTDATGRFGSAFSVSSNGVIVFQPTTRTPRQLTWFDRNGRALATVGEPTLQSVPVLSPRTGEVAVDLRRGIWILDLNSGVGRPLTEAAGGATYAVWSPIDDRLIFASRRKGREDLYETRATASPGAEHVLYADNLDKFPTSWSPDGKYLLFQAVSPDTGADIWVLPLTGERTPRPLIKTPATERQARFSPDGRWVAYTSDQSGRTEVYVTPFPGPGRSQPVSTAGGDAPRWGHSGKELFFVTPDKFLNAASIETGGDSVIVREVKRLFEVNANGVLTAVYDAAADGQKFLVVSPVAETRLPSLSLIVNWPAGLPH